MDPIVKLKWIVALRSDKYTQGRGRLSDSKGMCCLGVLADVCGANWRRYGESLADGGLVPWIDEAQVGRGGVMSDALLNDEFLAKVGLTDSQQRDLARMNDGIGGPQTRKTFSEIADHVEQEF